MGKTIDIGGRIHNPEVGNVVTGANEILDDTKNKKQDVINGEVDSALEALEANKQDNLTFDQTPTESSTNPVTSGGVYAADLALQQAIEAILTLIPSAASDLNQLADKSFVNSSIATASATFRGTYNLVSDLHLSVTASHQDIATALASVVSTADNNDYCFVQIPTSDTSSDIRVTERYKFDGTAWQYEYDLNNSGFTATQWEAINSGITALLVTKLGALPTAAELATSLAGKQNVLTFDNVPVSGSDNPVKSGGLYQLFAAIDAKMPSDASANNKLVAENRLAAYVTAIIEALDASFDVTSTDGHVTFRITQTNGQIASVQILTSDIASASQVSTNTSDIAALQALYNALQQSAPQIIQPTDTWPVANPSATVIYRVIDRVNTPPQYYSDYMFKATDLTTPVLMAIYNNAIDPIPTIGSHNLVESGGVFDYTKHIGQLGKTYGIGAFTSDVIYLFNGQTHVFGGTWVSTDFIAVGDNKGISFKGFRFSSPSWEIALVSFFDSSKNFIGCVKSMDYGYASGGTFAEEIEDEVMLPVGCAYVRVVSLTSVIDSYVSFSYGLTKSVNRIGDIGDYTKFTSDNVYLAGGTYRTFAGCKSTDFIRIPDNAEKVLFKGLCVYSESAGINVAMVAFFDISQQYISSFNSSQGTADVDNFYEGEVSIPSNAKYIRVAGKENNINEYYSFFGGIEKKLNDIQIEIDNIKNSKQLKGINVCTVGDSLTQGVDYFQNVIAESYPYFMSKKLGCNIVNYGQMGRTPKTWWELYKDVHQFDPSMDVVLIMFGTNGGMTENTLATDVEPYDDWHDYANTDVGDYCKLIEWIQEQTNNHAQIILITSPVSTYTNPDVPHDPDHPETWDQGWVTEHARPVTIAIAERYNIPVIDAWLECGMNKFNGDVFRPHDGCHFSAKGYHRLGTFIGSRLVSFFSYWSSDDVYPDETPST